MVVRTWQKSPERRYWSVEVRSVSTLIFSSDWVSVRLRSERAARVLSEWVTVVAATTLYRPPPGHYQNRRFSNELDVRWHPEGHFTDGGAVISFHESTANLLVEHLDGPVTGGVWWWRATSDGTELTLDSDIGIEGKSCAASKWVAELAGTYLILLRSG